MSGRGKSKKSIAIIDAALKILKEIWPASVRAICYRLFVAGLIPSMHKNETNKVSRQLVYAREQGVIPWEWIVDETRAPERVSSWASPQEIFEAAARQYRFDFWSMQPNRVEIWSEKGTVRGTLAPILDEYAITFRVMHGHASATALHDAAEMSIASEKPLYVLYVGDHDPSGMHMSEVDIPERIERYGGCVHIRRVAINVLDISNPDVPSFPVADKRTDPRHDWYVKNFDKGSCWELDALNPAELRERVEDEVLGHLDLEAWGRAEKVEQAQREATAKYVAGLPASISRRASKYDRSRG